MARQGRRKARVRGVAPSSRRADVWAQQTLDIDDLAGKGDGVGRLPSGEVVFVPGTAPGDRVRVALAGRRGGVLRGEVVERLRDGASRREPPCPVADRCGGCAWLHVALPEQHRVKAAIAARALAPSAAPTFAGGADELGWRRRARLHLRGDGRSAEIGLLATGSDQLVPLRACPALTPRLSALIPVLRDRLAGLTTTAELLLIEGAEGVALSIFGKRTGAMPSEAAMATLAEGLHGVVLDLGGTQLRHGQDTVTLAETAADPAPIQCSAGGFAQAAASGNVAIRAAVRAALAEAVQDRGGRFDRAHEAYAGSGNLSPLILAAAETLHLRELDAAAGGRARATLTPVFGERVQVEVTDVEAAAAPAGGDGVLWVLDPGRPGAAALAKHAASAAPEAILYVSCAPDTLRRDLQMLRAGGYHVRSSRWLDTMPGTPHLEVVALLQRSA